MKKIDKNQLAKQILPSVRWWEKRRLVFNLLLICFHLIIIAGYSEEVSEFSKKYEVSRIDIFILVILQILVANLFFCLGWLVEISIGFFNSGNTSSYWNRKLVFILGVVFSFLYTFLQYDSVLVPWGPS